MMALVVALPACVDITEPEDDAESQLLVTSDPAPTAAALYTYNPPVQLPPIQPKPTFWTCAAAAEGTFATAATQILILEVQALTTQDPFQRAVLLAEVERRKFEAKKALYFALTVCVDTYGAPRFWAVPDESGNLVFMPFSVGAYHAYLVEKYLEKPE
jgi:hypothetical protein